MFIFPLQNSHLKPKIDCKNKGKWKLQTFFSRYYDFAFTNLLKMRQRGMSFMKENGHKARFVYQENYLFCVKRPSLFGCYVIVIMYCSHIGYLTYHFCDCN